MSIFGTITILILVLVAINYKKKLSAKVVNVYLITLFSIQIFFVFINFLSYESMGNLLGLIRLIIFAFVIWGIFKISKSQQNKKLFISILWSFIIILVGYTEFFNGVYSFKNQSEFYSICIPLKKYYYVIPSKIIKASTTDIDGGIKVYYLDFFNSTSVKIDNQGNLFYRKTGWGTMDGYWFKFGVPKAEQI